VSSATWFVLSEHRKIVNLDWRFVWSLVEVSTFLTTDWVLYVSSKASFLFVNLRIPHNCVLRITWTWQFYLYWGWTVAGINVIISLHIFFCELKHITIFMQQSGWDVEQYMFHPTYLLHNDPLAQAGVLCSRI